MVGAALRPGALEKAPGGAGGAGGAAAFSASPWWSPASPSETGEGKGGDGRGRSDRATSRTVSWMRSRMGRIERPPKVGTHM